MPDRLLARAAMATLLCLTTTAVPVQTLADAPGTMNAERGWSSIARCVQEDSERARHTCMDRVLREAGLLTNEMRTRQQRRAFGLDEKTAREPPPPSAATVTPPVAAANPPADTANQSAHTAEALKRRAGEKTPSGATSPAAAAPSAQPDRIEVELVAVNKAVDGRLSVTTSDGAVWLQTESVEMPQPPVSGDRMTIRKGAMGGYRCSVASTHLTYRCARSH